METVSSTWLLCQNWKARELKNIWEDGDQENQNTKNTANTKIENHPMAKVVIQKHPYNVTVLDQKLELWVVTICQKCCYLMIKLLTSWLIV